MRGGGGGEDGDAAFMLGCLRKRRWTQRRKGGGHGRWCGGWEETSERKLSQSGSRDFSLQE